MKIFKSNKTARQKLSKSEIKRFDNLKYTLNKMGIKNNIKSLNQQVTTKDSYLKAIQKMEFMIEKERIKKVKSKNKLKGLEREYSFYKRVDKYKAVGVKEKLIKETYKTSLREVKKIKDKVKRDKEIKKIEKKFKKDITKNEHDKNILELGKLKDGSYNGTHIQNKFGFTKKIEDVHYYNKIRKEAQTKLKKEMRELKKTDRKLYDFLMGEIPPGIKLQDIKEADDILIGKDKQEFKNIITPKTFHQNYMFYENVNKDWFSLKKYLREERRKVVDVFCDKKFAYIPNAKRLHSTLMESSEIAYYKFYERYGGKTMGEIYVDLRKMTDDEVNEYLQELIDYVEETDNLVNDYYS